MKKVITHLLLLFVVPCYAQTLTQVNSSAGFDSPAVFQGKLFFRSNDGTNGDGLYYIDGSSNTLHFITSLTGNPSDLREAGGKLFFLNDDGTHGRELWATDGTVSGTGMVKDINAGIADGVSDLTNFIAFQNKLFFVAHDGTSGAEIWVSDGTASGTTLLKDINPGSGTSIDLLYGGPVLTVFHNAIYFFANDNIHNKEVWTSDGTTAGTMMVADNSTYYNEYSIIKTFNNRLWFTEATSSQFTYDIFTIDTNGTATNLSSIIPSWQGKNKSLLYKPSLNGTGTDPLIFNNSLLIKAADTSYYASDGTLSGTQEIPTITGWITEPLVCNGKIYFVSNLSLYAADITANTLLAPGISSYGAYPNEVNGKVCFNRNDSYGAEPWITDGTPSGTSRLKDLNPGSGDGITSNGQWTVVPYNGQLYFADVFSASDLWGTDGTSAGTQKASAPVDSFLADLSTTIVFNGCLYLNAWRSFSSYPASSLWKYCGGTSGITDVTESPVTVYPNPVSTDLFIKGNDMDHYEITSLVGQSLQSGIVSNSGISVAGLASGVYLVHVTSKTGSSVVKFIKE